MGEFNLRARELQERCFYMSKNGLVEVNEINTIGILFEIIPKGTFCAELWGDLKFNNQELKYRLATSEEYKKQEISEEDYEIF